MMVAGNGDFDANRKLIEYRFDQLDHSVQNLSTEVKELRSELYSIRMKLALFGGASGLLGWAIPQMIYYLASNGGSP